MKKRGTTLSFHAQLPPHLDDRPDHSAEHADDHCGNAHHLPSAGFAGAIPGYCWFGLMVVPGLYQETELPQGRKVPRRLLLKEFFGAFWALMLTVLSSMELGVLVPRGCNGCLRLCCSGRYVLARNSRSRSFVISRPQSRRHYRLSPGELFCLDSHQLVPRWWPIIAEYHEQQHLIILLINLLPSL